MATPCSLATHDDSMFSKYAMFNHAYVPLDMFMNFAEMHFISFLPKKKHFPSFNPISMQKLQLLYINYQ